MFSKFTQGHAKAHDSLALPAKEGYNKTYGSFNAGLKKPILVANTLRNTDFAIKAVDVTARVRHGSALHTPLINRVAAAYAHAQREAISRHHAD